MDAALFIKMLSDKAIVDLKKMQYKYGKSSVTEFIQLLKNNVYTSLPINDFLGNPCVYLKNITQMNSAAKILFLPQNEAYGIEAMESEVYFTLAIESIDSSRESIRKIFKGFAPNGKQENRIYGMKKGLEFISDKNNLINEENIYQLYLLAIADTLEDEDRLLPGNYYRHDTVYVVGTEIEHTGIDHTLLPEYMKQFVSFIQADDKINELEKADMIHFYCAYLHPYFDGNGRMSRLLHQWYLVQKGYSSTMFVSFSYHIEHSRTKYYQAYKQIEDNAKVSGVMDLTPFLLYFAENVYNKIETEGIGKIDSIAIFDEAKKAGKITEKENDLWNFVLSAYAYQEFSTKKLEKDFGNAAYATIRSFVTKFTELGLLTTIQYGNRVKYKVK